MAESWLDIYRLVCRYREAYYERAGYHSAVFVEADCEGLATATRLTAGAQAASLVTKMWKESRPSPEHRLYCDIRQAWTLLNTMTSKTAHTHSACDDPAADMPPLSRLQWVIDGDDGTMPDVAAAPEAQPETRGRS